MCGVSAGKLKKHGAKIPDIKNVLTISISFCLERRILAGVSQATRLGLELGPELVSVRASIR